MEEVPVTKRAWFYITVWLVLLLAFYGWQVYRMGVNLQAIFADLVCIFPFLLVLWMAFFSQFVLPVKTFRDRQKIFDRLITFLFGGHGPALFIENGVVKERSEERQKKGPGVIWLDTASAAVTRTAVKIKQTLGPGVHFIKRGEYIAGTVDLHIQTQTLGPRETDNPFGGHEDDPNDEEYKGMQDRRKMVSALSRDGIEIVPTISISFRVDTGFPMEGESGSRFGYRTGITRKAKENEEKDKEAIRKAILGEGVNTNLNADTSRKTTVAWNELPAALAVDVWREYASKFTLNEMFNPEQLIPAVSLLPLQPIEVEIDPFSQPVQVTAIKPTMKDRSAKMLREVNVILSKAIRWLEGASKVQQNERPDPTGIIKSSTPPKIEPIKGTALQVINEVVNARLTSQKVIVLDDHGNQTKNSIDSPEFTLLKNRGIKVLSVSIGNLRFDKDIEDKIIANWSTSWLKNAKAEGKQIERKQNIARSAGQEKAIRQYANLLTDDLVRKNPQEVKETLKILLLRTRTIIINNDQLRKDMNEEQQTLEDILRWVEDGS